MGEGFRRRKFHFLIAAVVFVLDLATKWLVEERIPLHDQLTVIPGFFRLTHVQNRGAAFGLFDDSPHEWKGLALILFSLVALAVVVYLLWKNSHVLNSTGIALALVLGGALGNLYDRLIAGHVTDFLDFYVGSYHWPAFNVADSAIVAGALLLVAEILFTKDTREETTA